MLMFKWRGHLRLGQLRPGKLRFSQLRLGQLRLGQRREEKKQENKQLWGRDFNVVRSGLDEKQVVSFVDELVKQRKASSSASFRSFLKTAVAEAGQITDSIKMRAQEEAEEEAASIIAQANQEAEEIRRRAEAAAEEVEEPVQLQEEVTEEKVEEPVQLQEEVTEEKVEEPVGATAEGLLEQRLPEERPEREETEPALLEKDRQALYTGEVELAIGVPVDLKMISRLYNSLQTMPEVRILRTRGSTNRGSIITVALGKPIPLISVISSKIPGVAVTPEPPEKDRLVRGKPSPLLGKGKKGVRRIKLALKGE